MRFFLQVSQLLPQADRAGKPYSPNLHKSSTSIKYLKSNFSTTAYEHYLQITSLVTRQLLVYRNIRVHNKQTDETNKYRKKQRRKYRTSKREQDSQYSSSCKKKKWRLRNRYHNALFSVY